MIQSKQSPNDRKKDLPPSNHHYSPGAGWCPFCGYTESAATISTIHPYRTLNTAFSGIDSSLALLHINVTQDHQEAQVTMGRRTIVSQPARPACRSSGPPRARTNIGRYIT